MEILSPLRWMALHGRYWWRRKDSNLPGLGRRTWVRPHPALPAPILRIGPAELHRASRYPGRAASYRLQLILEEEIPLVVLLGFEPKYRGL